MDPNYYKVFEAFQSLDTIDWRQTAKNIDVGDIVYVYTGRPIQVITHKCQVLDVNIPGDKVDTSDTSFNIGSESDPSPLLPYDRYMRLKLLKEYDPMDLSYSKLVAMGLKGSIQGQRHTGPDRKSVV